MRQFKSLLALAAVIGFASLALADDAGKDKKPQQTATATKPCEGTLQLKTKSYKLAHAVAYASRVFDEDAITVILSDTAIPVDKLKSALRDGKGRDDSFVLFQPNVKLTYSKSGELRYCNAWADNYSISVSGGNLKGELAIKDGRAQGKATLANDEQDKPKSFDLRFDLAMLDTLPPPPKSEPAKEKKPKSDKQARKHGPKEAGTGPNAHVLPIPKDATDIEFKELVGHIKFSSPSSDVKTMAAFLSQKLGDQGWAKDGSDLMTPKSAILKRKKASALLTIFVKPATNGSTVTMMTEGMSWEEPKSASDPPKP